MGILIQLLYESLIECGCLSLDKFENMCQMYLTLFLCLSFNLQAWATPSNSRPCIRHYRQPQPLPLCPYLRHQHLSPPTTPPPSLPQKSPTTTQAFSSFFTPLPTAAAPYSLPSTPPPPLPQKSLTTTQALSFFFTLYLLHKRLSPNNISSAPYLRNHQQMVYILLLLPFSHLFVITLAWLTCSTTSPHPHQVHHHLTLLPAPEGFPHKPEVRLNAATYS